jgi:hypothetical protein
VGRLLFRRKLILLAVVATVCLMTVPAVAANGPQATPSPLCSNAPGSPYFQVQQVCGQGAGSQGSVWAEVQGSVEAGAHTPSLRPSPAVTKANPVKRCSYERLNPDRISYAVAGAVGTSSQQLAVIQDLVAQDDPSSGFTTVALPEGSVIAADSELLMTNCPASAGEIYVYTPAAPAPPHPPAPVPTPAASPFAIFVSDTVNLPALSIGVAPAAQGITGLESYFWVSGYSGAAVPRTRVEGPYTINLVATPVGYTWSFGDGSSLSTASLGTPYSASEGAGADPVGHTYAVRSELSPQAVNGAYLVSVTATFDTKFQVIGPGMSGAWADLSALGVPPLTKTATLAYPVGEVVSALTLPDSVP